MSYSYALAGERSASGLSRRWLLACTLSQLVCLAAAAAIAAIAQHLQWPAGSREMLALHLALAAIYGLTFGYLRGCVLRDGLARFPLLVWCLAIAAISFFILPPAPAALAGMGVDSTMPAMARALAPVALQGFGYGLLIGAIEAFVMRRAAFGLIAWLLISALAWAIGLAAASLGMTFSSARLVPMLGAGATEMLFAVAAVFVVALAMLAALRLLKPQLSYYGPRVYRPLLRR
jgi:hypothetical protein